MLNIFQFCLFFLITSIEEIQVNQLFLLFSWYWFWRKFRAVSKKEKLWYIQLLQGLFRALPQNFELKLVTEIVSSIHFTFTRNNGKFMDKAVLVLLMLVLFYEKQRNWNRLYFTVCKITSCGQCFMSFNFFYQRRTGNRKSFLTRIFNVEGGKGGDWGENQKVNGEKYNERSVLGHFTKRNHSRNLQKWVKSWWRIAYLKWVGKGVLCRWLFLRSNAVKP